MEVEYSKNAGHPLHKVGTLALLALASAVSCDADGSNRVAIREVRPAEPVGEATESKSDAERLGFAPASAETPTAALPGFEYEIPAGWEEAPPAQFRDPNFGHPDHPTAEFYVTVLEGTGGGLAANINRWRGQFGLEPLEEAELASLPKVPVTGGEGSFVSFRGQFRGMGTADAQEDAMLLGIVVEQPERSIFIKMTGPAGFIETQTEAFKQFAESLQVVPGGSRIADAATTGGMAMALPAGHPPMGGFGDALPEGHPDLGQALPEGHPELPGGVPGMPPGMVLSDMSTASGLVTWDKPEEWTEAPTRPMREATFHAGPENTVECYVSILGGGAGDMLANVNRWRGQMGREPLNEEDVEAFEEIEILGQEAPLVEIEGPYRGMGGEAHEDALMLGTTARLGEQTVFIKMVGPKDEVSKQREAFVAFCRSLRAAKAEAPATD